MSFSIGSNLIYSILQLLINLISSSLLFIILGNKLSMENFGLLNFGITFSGILINISDFGYSQLAQKEIANNKIPINEYVSNSVFQKILFSLFISLLTYFYLILNFNESKIEIGLIFIFNSFITSIVIYLQAIFRAKFLYKANTLSSIIYLLSLIGLITLIKNDLTVLNITLVLFTTKLIQMIFLIIEYIRNFKILKLNISFNFQKVLFQKNLSYGITSSFLILYFSIDNQIISYYLGDVQLAIYQSYNKIIFLFINIYVVLDYVLTPYLARLYFDSKEILLSLINDFNRLLLFFVVIGLFSLLLFSDILLNMFYSGKYNKAEFLILPMSLMFFFKMLNTIFTILISLTDSIRPRLVISFSALVLNLFLNFSFIPIYGINAAAYIGFITHLLIFILSYYYVKREIINLQIDKRYIFVCIISLGFSYLFIYQLNIQNIYTKLILFIISIIILYIFNFSFSSILKRLIQHYRSKV